MTFSIKFFTLSILKHILASLTSPRRKSISKNLIDINKESTEGVITPGKVFSQGEINKKMKVVALNFSEEAKDKLKKASCDVSNILDEIKKNPEMKGLKILK